MVLKFQIDGQGSFPNPFQIKDLLVPDKIWNMIHTPCSRFQILNGSKHMHRPWPTIQIQVCFHSLNHFNFSWEDRGWHQHRQSFFLFSSDGDVIPLAHPHPLHSTIHLYDIIICWFRQFLIHLYFGGLVSNKIEMLGVRKWHSATPG